MVSDLEFFLGLRGTVSRYLRAVDAWELAYKRFSQMARRPGGLSPELDQAQAEYRAARKLLEAGVPRARRLGLRYGARDPWSGLLRVAMGQSIIGRNERTAIEECLDHLLAACQNEAAAEQLEGRRGTPSPARSPSWIQRVKDYFL